MYSVQVQRIRSYQQLPAPLKKAKNKTRPHTTEVSHTITLPAAPEKETLYCYGGITARAIDYTLYIHIC